MINHKKEFDNVWQNVRNSANLLECTGCGVMVVHKGEVVLEK